MNVRYGGEEFEEQGRAQQESWSKLQSPRDRLFMMSIGAAAREIWTHMDALPFRTSPEAIADSCRKVYELAKLGVEIGYLSEACGALFTAEINSAASNLRNLPDLPIFPPISPSERYESESLCSFYETFILLASETILDQEAFELKCFVAFADDASWKIALLPWQSRAQWTSWQSPINVPYIPFFDALTIGFFQVIAFYESFNVLLNEQQMNQGKNEHIARKFQLIFWPYEKNLRFALRYFEIAGKLASKIKVDQSEMAIDPTGFSALYRALSLNKLDGRPGVLEQQLWTIYREAAMQGVGTQEAEQKELKRPEPERHSERR